VIAWIKENRIVVKKDIGNDALALIYTLIGMLFLLIVAFLLIGCHLLEKTLHV
jgi:hypothetical protein